MGNVTVNILDELDRVQDAVFYGLHGFDNIPKTWREILFMGLDRLPRVGDRVRVDGYIDAFDLDLTGCEGVVNSIHYPRSSVVVFDPDTVAPHIVERVLRAGAVDPYRTIVPIIYLVKTNLDRA